MPPSIDELNFSSLDLAPKRVKKANQHTKSDDIWAEAMESKGRIELVFGPQKSFITKLPRFLAVEWMIVDVAFGGLIIMYAKDRKLSMAVVRRMEKQDGFANVQKGVIEVLQGEVSLVDLVNGAKQNKGVLLTKDDNYELILPADRYVLGSVIKLKQGEVILDRVLEFSSSFIRYAVQFKAG